MSEWQPIATIPHSRPVEVKKFPATSDKDVSLVICPKGALSLPDMGIDPTHWREPILNWGQFVLRKDSDDE